jgi:hypothetical protein
MNLRLLLKPQALLHYNRYSYYAIDVIGVLHILIKADCLQIIIVYNVIVIIMN